MVTPSKRQNLVLTLKSENTGLTLLLLHQPQILCNTHVWAIAREFMFQGKYTALLTKSIAAQAVRRLDKDTLLFP